jgi:hypothetical protein
MYIDSEYLQYIFRNDPEHADGFFLVTGVILAGLFYGGLHLFAWIAPFPNQTQHLLWNISGLAVIVSGPFLVTLLSFMDLMISSDTRLENRTLSRLESIVYDLMLVPLLLGLILAIAGVGFYLFARTYLVVECFISFAYLPESAFKQPSWTEYFPHF